MLYGLLPHQLLHPGTEMDMSGGRSGGPPRGVLERHADREISKLLSAAGYRCGYAGKWHVGTWGPTESLTGREDTAFENLCPIHDRDVPQAVRRFIGEAATPWFCVASLDNPHNIHEWAVDAPLPWGNLPDPPGLRDLPALPANYAPPPSEPRVVRRLRGDDDRLPAGQEQWRRYRWAYNQLVTKVDAQVGKVLDALEASCQADRTLVLFTSDHGDMNAAHQLAFKHVLYEESAAVPLLLAGPGLPAGDEPRCVSAGLDLYPTILEAAGCPVPDDLPGRSLLTGGGDEGEDELAGCVVCETHVGGSPGRMLRTGRYKYIVYSKGPIREQLFDMDTDPGEMVNLASCSSADDLLHRHRRLLGAWFNRTDDRFDPGHYTHPDTRWILPGQEYDD
jgi:arylsulfatase A-like enzyme